MPYYKIIVSTSEILEAKDEVDATKQMTSIIRELKPDDFDWETEDVTESPFLLHTSQVIQESVFR